MKSGYKKKRCCIFVFYDFEGIVDDYVVYLLESLEKVIDNMIVVTNACLTEESRKILKDHSEHLIERDNIGFDAGAYKDVLYSMGGKSYFSTYDELFLINDTFYGPIYALDKIFEKMDCVKEDFWGLTRCSVDEKKTKFGLFPHIQSYFIVLKNRILNDEKFYDFFEKMIYPSSIEEAVIVFEVGLSQYLYSFGYSSTTYIDICGGSEIMNRLQNAYIKSPLELMEKYKYPVIKRKIISPLFIDEYKKIIRMVNNQNVYDVNLIIKHIDRLDNARKLAPYGFYEIKEFCERYENIYIFGHGVYGKSLQRYIGKECDKSISRFVVSHANENNFMEIALDDFSLNSHSGLIIALNYANYVETKELLLEKFDIKQMLFPRYY